MQSLWRSDTRTINLIQTSSSSEEFVFPSGRQAIMHTLRHMRRQNRVAVAEFSSQCVFNAVAKYATPIPIKEVVKNNINVDVFMVYEQWGWTYSDNAISEVLNKYDRVIFDCVDSPDAYIRHKDASSVVVSLSKCLGLKGGAILLEEGILQRSECKLSHHLNLDINDSGQLHMINSYLNTNSHIENLSSIDIFSELEKESNIRRKNLNLFADSSLSNSWSDWMLKAVDNNCSAGIVPLFKGEDVQRLHKIQTDIMNQLNIHSEIYNFNYSGSPLIADYQPCIAFPIHGDISNMQVNIKALASLMA